jgi:hypothetical protein
MCMTTCVIVFFIYMWADYIALYGFALQDKDLNNILYLLIPVQSGNFVTSHGYRMVITKIQPLSI